MSSFSELLESALIRNLYGYDAKIRVMDFESNVLVTVFLKRENRYIEYRISKRDFSEDFFNNRDSICYLVKKSIKEIMKLVER